MLGGKRHTKNSKRKVSEIKEGAFTVPLFVDFFRRPLTKRRNTYIEI